MPDLADAKSLEGTYLAWLSDDNSAPASKFSKTNTGYLRVDLVKVADTWADLTDGSLQNPLFRTETNVAPGSTDVWTNTTTAGNKVNNTEDCSNWTAGLLGLGREGRNNATNGDWTNTSLLDDSICSTKQRLYCFEQ